MKISWNEIIEKSWHHVRKHKFLWGLGVLAALTEGGAGFSSYSGGSGSGWETDGSQEISKVFDTASAWVTSHVDLIIIGLAAFFIIGLIILYVSYSARAGLIHSVNTLESGKEKLTFAEAFDIGQRYFWPLLGLTLLVAAAVLVAILIFLILIAALILLVIASLWFLILVIPLGLILITALVIFCWYINLILLIASRELVIAGLGVFPAFKSGHHLILENLGQILLGWLIILGLGLAASLALGIAIVFVGGILVLFGVGIYFIGKWTGVIIYAVPVGLALLALMLTISGIINAYFSTFWTLVYKELVK